MHNLYPWYLSRESPSGGSDCWFRNRKCNVSTAQKFSLCTQVTKMEGKKLTIVDTLPRLDYGRLVIRLAVAIQCFQPSLSLLLHFLLKLWKICLQLLVISSRWSSLQRFESNKTHIDTYFERDSNMGSKISDRHTQSCQLSCISPGLSSNWAIRPGVRSCQLKSTDQ